MNVNEIMSKHEGKFNNWEIYSWNSNHHSIHTDYVDDLENGTAGRDKPVTYKASAVDTWELMDKDDYANTILANQGVSIDEIDDEDFPVLVMVLENADTFRIDYNTGAGNIEMVGDLEEAQAAADEGAAYTGQPIIIYDANGNEVSRREWYGVKYNPDEADATDPIEFGDYGYYADWTE